MSSVKKNQVVIVGGSSAATVAAQISKARAKFDPAKNDLILISQLPYHIHLLAAARFTATSEGNLDSTSQAFIPFDQLFSPGNAGTFVQGKVVRVLEKHVELEDGRSFPFDFLLLGMGSRWPQVMDYDYTRDEDVKRHIGSWRDKITSANSVVIIGGGAVGVGKPLGLFLFHRTASDAKGSIQKWPQKSSTIILTRTLQSSKDPRSSSTIRIPTSSATRSQLAYEH